MALGGINMKLGFIGLGRMGYNMCLNLLEHKHKLVVYDISPEPAKKLAKKGAVPAFTVKEVIDKLPKPRIVWIMIPAKFVDSSLKEIIPLLNKGDHPVSG